MSQPARKPGDPGSSKFGNSVPADDPSIPVLTERLTLPPLDLNLDFRLPERPAPAEPETITPLPELPIEPLQPVEPIEPLEARDRVEPRGFDPLEPRGFDPLEPGEPVESAPGDSPSEAALEAAPAEEPSAYEEDRATTVMGPPTVLEPPEPADDAPRVPTSLLVSNIDALLPTPPGTTPYRESDEFDITQSDGSRSNRLETDLREMILLELARRLPSEVEAIVRRHLEGAIEEAVRRFAAEVRIALAGSLREIVDRAVKAELDRLNVPRG